MLIDLLYNIVITPLELIFDAVFYYFQTQPVLGIFAISLVMNFLALPLYKQADRIQEEERKKVESMSKWVSHIKKTFKGDERYLILTRYYKQENYKPVYALRSVVPLLLQVPFFVAAYHYLSNQPLLNGVSFLFLKDLGSPDQLVQIFCLTINVMPIIMTALNIISGYIYLRGFPLKDKIQTYGIAIVFLVLLYNSPSGLVLYWTLNQVFSICKNLFMKTFKTKKAKNIFCSCTGIILFTILFALGWLGSISRICVAIMIMLVFQIPMFCSIYKTRIKKDVNQKSTGLEKSPKPILFFMGSLLCTVFLGLMIPADIVQASPTEFFTNTITPLELLLMNFAIYFGFFVFWLGIYYLLFNIKIKNILTIAVWIISGIIIIDYFLFSKDLGIISTTFIYDVLPEFSLSEQLLNLVIIILSFFVLYMIFHKYKKWILYIYVVIFIACFGITLKDVITINTVIAESIKTATIVENNQNDYDNVIQLSKTGKNVVVLVMDRACGCYVPYIFNERPEFQNQFSGFTYYPNTVSFGEHTVFGAPPIYGGYEYTPTLINERTEETLADKNDEALNVLPYIMADNGYQVTLCDMASKEVMLNSQKASEKSGKVINYYALDGVFSQNYIEQYGEEIKSSQKRNLFFYCLFRTVPVVMKPYIYHEGKYCSTHFQTSEDFIDAYSVLENMSEITSIKDDENNNLTMLYNVTTHSPTTLSDNYEPTFNGCGYNGQNYYYDFEGHVLKFETEMQYNQYAVNLAAYIQIGKWLDKLKKEGVYDNTRIIVVSDHGISLNQIDELLVGENLDIQGSNSVLMVKDFNSNDNFKINDNFMTVADTPYLVFTGLIDNPLNPYSGYNLFNLQKNDGILMTTSHNFMIDENENNVFDTSDGHWWHVQNNIFDKSNWTMVQ